MEINTTCKLLSKENLNETINIRQIRLQSRGNNRDKEGSYIKYNNLPRSYSNPKYVCAKVESFKMHKGKTDRTERRNRIIHNYILRLQYPSLNNC